LNKFNKHIANGVYQQQQQEEPVEHQFHSPGCVAWKSKVQSTVVVSVTGWKNAVFFFSSSKNRLPFAFNCIHEDSKMGTMKSLLHYTKSFINV
jgi:hypothetical protein